MASKINQKEILAQFYDDGVYSVLYEQGAVSAAFGCANGQQAYAVWQDGAALGAKDVDKMVHVLELAARWSPSTSRQALCWPRAWMP